MTDTMSRGFEISITLWKELSKRLTEKQTYYDSMTKLRQLNKKEKYKIEKELRLEEYFLWITSPHLKGNASMKLSVAKDILLDFERFERRNERIRNVDVPNSTKRIHQVDIC